MTYLKNWLDSPQSNLICETLVMQDYRIMKDGKYRAVRSRSLVKFNHGNRKRRCLLVHAETGIVLPHLKVDVKKAERNMERWSETATTATFNMEKLGAVMNSFKNSLNNALNK
jgi:hypothetical protein